MNGMYKEDYKKNMNTKLNQTKLGKYDPHAAMIRLVRELTKKLEDNELINQNDITQIDNVVYGFLSQLPKKVEKEIIEG